jgi:hypothetical protein
MGMAPDPETQGKKTTKPPRSQWSAAPFWDLRASHYAQAFLAICLLVVAGLQWFVYRQQAGIMERALVAVERPILVISIPDRFRLLPERLQFYIDINNIGKQVANTNGIVASLIVQRDSNFPVRDDPNDGSMCTAAAPAVGQLIIPPNSDKVIVCSRQKSLTPEQVSHVIGRQSYAFFRVTVIYNDSIGNDRLTTWVALFRTIDQDTGKFVQIFSGDRINETLLSADQQEQNQRALIDTILTIERERKSAFPDQ